MYIYKKYIYIYIQKVYIQKVYNIHYIYTKSTIYIKLNTKNYT